jgi:hypothetical protein
MYIKALILISPNWNIEFHVHIDALLLTIGAMLTHNLIGKHVQLIVYDFKLLNNGERNCSTIEHETLAMVFAFHKFKITY